MPDSDTHLKIRFCQRESGKKRKSEGGGEAEKANRKGAKRGKGIFGRERKSSLKAGL
jgi:hypothetical protein